MEGTSKNFGFLEGLGPHLVKLATVAEGNFHLDPNTTLYKLRQFGELLAQSVAACAGIAIYPGESQSDLLGRLRREGLLESRAADLFHTLRKTGNRAVHELAGTHGEALHHLKMARELGVWFIRTFGRNPSFSPGPFLPPPKTPSLDPKVQARIDELAANLEAAQKKVLAQEEAKASALASAEEQAKETAFWEKYASEVESEKAAAEQKLAELRANADTSTQALETTRQAVAAADVAIELDEADTRKLIDQKLRDAGWEADSETLTYSNGTRPHKSRDLAIAEWPTASGPADYALFCGRTLVGLIEAKRHRIDVSGALQQTKRYSRDIAASPDFDFPTVGPWGEYQVPFLFATNGRPRITQIPTKSGIWYWNASRPTEPSRDIEGWYTPRGLKDLLAQDVVTAEAKLATEPFSYMSLRGYQETAIRSIEKAITAGQRECLLAMATGTGKTRTALGLIYRLVKANRFRRILFVVDRTALGKQAGDSFSTVKLEQHKSFTEIYDMKQLGDIEPDDDTRLQITTVQSLVRRILGASDPAETPTIDQYDLIIIDECHRGYNLDRELSDSELEFRDEADYISKYRKVVDYFDAIKIGLTATPALHTTEIFGDPVFAYGYREAVLDGFLVDHAPPHKIKTQLSSGGIQFRAGEEISTYRTSSKQVELFHLPDDVEFEVAEFNRKVITESFNKTVCDYLATQIDPTGDAKTLIFCANIDHADLVVSLLKKSFLETYGEIDDDAVIRITGNSDKPLELIRRYKNEKLPNVVVTVDLLTTGIDVPEVTNIVFLRRVRSRILFEQMLGRATRLADHIGKDVFHIYDCVDLYETLEPVTSMRPVVTRPKISIDQLATELATVTEPSHVTEVFDQLVSKLRARTRRLTGKRKDAFVEAADAEPEELIDRLRNEGPDAARAWLTEHPAAIAILDKPGSTSQRIYVSGHDDELLEVERGYGNQAKPEDYLEAFGEFVRNGANTIDALIVVTQRPRELTRAHLKELKRILDREHYNESALRTAHRAITNRDIAASIIGYVRQQALGEPLVPYDQRVSSAMQRILASREWNPVQRKWLERIALQLVKEVVVDREALDSGAFKEQGGGFKRMDKLFGGELETLLGDINAAVWADAG